jgi:hypothetical protein
MAMSIEHVYVHAAWQCPFCTLVSVLYMDMVTDRSHGHGHAAFTEPEDDILLIFWHSTYVYVRKQHISVKAGCYIVTLSAFPGKINRYDATGYISAAEVYSTVRRRIAMRTGRQVMVGIEMIRNTKGV